MRKRCSTVENLQRQDLNSVEETEGILQLLAIELNCSVDRVKLLLYRMKNSLEKESRSQGTDTPADNSTASAPDARGNVSPNPDREKVEAVFASLGKMNWQTFIRTRLPLLKLPPEILEALRQGRIEYTKAKAIAKLKVESARQALLEEAIENLCPCAKFESKSKPNSSRQTENNCNLGWRVSPKELSRSKSGTT